MCLEAEQVHRWYQQHFDSREQRFANKLKCRGRPVRIGHNLDKWFQFVHQRAKELESCPVKCEAFNRDDILRNRIKDLDVLVGLNGVMKCQAAQLNHRAKRAMLSLERMNHGLGWGPGLQTVKDFDMVISFNHLADIPINYFHVLNSDGCEAKFKCLENSMAYSWIENSSTWEFWNKSLKTFGALIVSNCEGRRMDLFKSLEKEGVSLTKSGRCFRQKFNITQLLKSSPHSADMNVPRAWLQEKFAFTKFFPFYFGFENGIEMDYLTEKFWLGLRMGNIPVIFGAPNLRDYWPFDSHPPWIDVLDFHNVSELSHELKSLFRNSTRYREKLRSLNELSPSDFETFINHWTNSSFRATGENSILCRICQYMHEHFCEED
jgi:hypothetical protein